MRLRDRPVREVRHREQQRPRRELAQVAAHEPDRPEHPERPAEHAEDERPEPFPVPVEEMLRERARGGRDDDQLERRPADVLRDVEPGRQVRASAAEGRTQEHHAGHAGIRADERGEREQRVPDERSDENREKRVAQRERRHEQRADDDHEQRHRQVPPQERRVEPAQDLQPRGDGVDAPAGSRVAHRR